ncbi:MULTISPECIES: helix-turn-helix domain-containing protein [Streptomyces]|uniref:HTH cro/C1-type domain-containing protein n=1 Tax=Streptomyces cacaoi TaxID=1898 RepID=A0A4Y3R2Y9_STRCI|nr:MULTISPECIES: helix-turn-helix transcriptional regulator [Streptomyces]NNG88651.1 helix-turn-helix transcriptional regulator [Streptomyces cacaoi]GEB51882.1 hypothetical protein SCA03_44330 [Streptomyces cacaoi]
MSLADNVRHHRRVAGLTQEQLAADAGLSLGVVKKVESGGNARVENLHALARALGTTTSALFAPGVPEPVRDDEGASGRLMALRRVLMPPIGLSAASDPAPGGPPVALDALAQQVSKVHRLYHGDRYEAVALELPGLLHEAHSAVDQQDGDERGRSRALTCRARVLLLTGKYLVQIRQYDLAYAALASAIDDARSTDDRLLAATGVIGLSWLLLRQDRFDECETLAARLADEIEPTMSDPQGTALAWGEAQLRVAAAAVRNNRPEVAREARRRAATAASAVGAEQSRFGTHWGTFGPVTVEAKAIEDLALDGNARGVLRRADEGAVSPKALTRCGRPSPASWYRHRMDVARAHVLLGSHQDAMDELSPIRQEAPEWIRHQKMARHLMGDILASRKRTLTQEMRDMAAHLGVVG